MCHSDQIVLSVNIRLDEAQISRLDRLAAVLKARVVGVDVTRADVIRTVLKRGIEIFEVDFKIDPSAA